VFQVRKSLTNYTCAPSTRHWKTTYLETILYTVTWSFDIMFHQSLVYMIEHDVFELDCDPPISIDISYRWWNLNSSLYCNLITVAAFSLKTVLTLSHSLHKHRPKNVGKPGATIWLQRREHTRYTYLSRKEQISYDLCTKWRRPNPCLNCKFSWTDLWPL
jgi:hypothetical protein